MALKVLQQNRLDIAGLRSKDWQESARPGAPPLDFAFTRCDRAASQPCPAWPGQPMTAHRGIEDPAAFLGSEAETCAFVRMVMKHLEARISVLVSLPISSLDRLALQRRLDEVGKVRAEAAEHA